MTTSPAIVLADVEIPKSSAGRPKRKNPYSELVKARLDVRDKAARFVVPVTDAQPADKLIAAIKRDLSAAARDHDVVVRRNVEHDEMGKTVTVTFWITDKPAPKDETADPVKGESKSK